MALIHYLIPVPFAFGALQFLPGRLARLSLRAPRVNTARVGLPTTLRAMGVPREKLAHLAEAAAWGLFSRAHPRTSVAADDPRPSQAAYE